MKSFIYKFTFGLSKSKKFSAHFDCLGTFFFYAEDLNLQKIQYTLLPGVI